MVCLNRRWLELRRGTDGAGRLRATDRTVPQSCRHHAT